VEAAQEIAGTGGEGGAAPQRAGKGRGEERKHCKLFITEALSDAGDLSGVVMTSFGTAAPKCAVADDLPPPRGLQRSTAMAPPSSNARRQMENVTREEDETRGRGVGGEMARRRYPWSSGTDGFFRRLINSFRHELKAI